MKEIKQNWPEKIKSQLQKLTNKQLYLDFNKNESRTLPIDNFFKPKLHNKIRVILKKAHHSQHYYTFNVFRSLIINKHEILIM